MQDLLALPTLQGETGLGKKSQDGGFQNRKNIDRRQSADGESTEIGQSSLKTKEPISHFRMRSGFLPTRSALLACIYRKKKKYTVILIDQKELSTGEELNHIAVFLGIDPHKEWITTGSGKVKVVA